MTDKVIATSPGKSWSIASYKNGWAFVNIANPKEVVAVYTFGQAKSDTWWLTYFYQPAAGAPTAKKFERPAPIDPVNFNRYEYDELQAAMTYFLGSPGTN